MKIKLGISVIFSLIVAVFTLNADAASVYYRYSGFDPYNDYDHNYGVPYYYYKNPREYNRLFQPVPRRWAPPQTTQGGYWEPYVYLYPIDELFTSYFSSLSNVASYLTEPAPKSSGDQEINEETTPPTAQAAPSGPVQGASPVIGAGPATPVRQPTQTTSPPAQAQSPPTQMQPTQSLQTQPVPSQSESESFLDVIDRANRLFRSGDDIHATTAYESAASLQPSNPVVIFGYALALNAVERYRQAAAELRRALHLYPQWYENPPSIATYYEQREHFRNHVETLREFVERNPQHLDAKFLLAYLHWTQGKPGDATILLQTVLNQDPKDEESQTMLENIRMK